MPLRLVKDKERVAALRCGSVEKHFHKRSAELQIPPLRYASVGMTKGRATLPFRFDHAEDEQQAYFSFA
jgi:hypothetical protein